MSRLSKDKRKERNKKEKKQKQEKNKKSNTREIISYIILIVLAIVIAQHLNVVVSGSMEPVFYRGDIVATENINTFGVQEFNPTTDVHVGDIVVYNAEWYPEPVIHRVIAQKDINGTMYFEIKGDNNPTPDPYYVLPSQIRSKVLTIGNTPIVIPKIGYVTLFIRGL